MESTPPTLASSSTTTAQTSSTSATQDSLVNSSTTVHSPATQRWVLQELLQRPAPSPPDGLRLTSSSASLKTSVLAPEAAAVYATACSLPSLRTTGTFVPTSPSILAFATRSSPRERKPTTRQPTTTSPPEPSRSQG